MRVAILGAGHWHMPLYEEALLQSGVEIVAISAAEPEARERLSQRFGCTAFSDERALADAVRFDFGFVFGRHRAMFDTARLLIERGIPFSLEKPGAFNAAGREKLRELAQARSLFVSFPLVYRVTELRRLLDEVMGDGDELANLSVRCFAGPPGRYLKNGSPWMVDPEQSGGGCTRNLAPHYVDLFLSRISGSVVSVSAEMNSIAYGAAVEDYSSIRLRTDRGATATIETGYNFPMPDGQIRDFSLVISTRTAFIRASEAAVEVFDRSGRTIRKQSWNIDSNPAFGPYVHDVLRRFRDGLPPVVGFDEFNAVMAIIDASYASRQTGGPVVP